MFGFSLPKLLVLVLIIAAIWYGFKWITKLDRDRRRAVKEEGAAETRKVDAEDMVKCPNCGTFVPAGRDHSCDA
ncbi:MAG: twin-arginine translocase TatA/TatE family subunit [Alphaproteobacteria bacterium]|nr:twin-arginine translocase TatA/TatE family subunit [Alphaproteobacteria bacterium]